MISWNTLVGVLRSSSSWGCELKYCLDGRNGGKKCHPLREDVSWNIPVKYVIQFLHVILFVRMWVEMILFASSSLRIRSSSSWGCELKCHWLLQSLLSLLSSSSWGCELKYYKVVAVLCGFRHPLREDVSWNAKGFYLTDSYAVILFVRMWVEILMALSLTVMNMVILFVRMWVEIPWILDYHVACQSSSSWGCELKYRISPHTEKSGRHPLREDVSWNGINCCGAFNGVVILFVRMWVEMAILSIVSNPDETSSSSWGCELKYPQHGSGR